MSAKADYTDLLSSLDLTLQDPNNEVVATFRNVPSFPNKPVFFYWLDDSKKEVLATIVLDPEGRIWLGKGRIDLSEFKFKDYWEFRNLVLRN